MGVLHRWLLACLLLVGAGSADLALAAPNVANAGQKGSLIVFPDIDIRGTSNTIVRISQDGSLNIDVKCVWVDGNRNRADFVMRVTRGQAVWFDARTGRGSTQVNRFPLSRSNGYDNPHLDGASADPYLAGMLVCFAVDGGEQQQVKWNHLSGTATVFDSTQGTAYEYSAYAFFVQNGFDLQPMGTPGSLVLNGLDYDMCPLYQIGQISPEGTVASFDPSLAFLGHRLAVAGCSQQLTQDWLPVTTKLLFDVWNEDEVKFSGAFECADSWHETRLVDIDSAQGNFTRTNLGTDTARYRVQGVKSTQCAGSQATGLVAVQASTLSIGGRLFTAATTLATAGKMQGYVTWNPQEAVPEGTR
jgi:hypothetical protein